MLITEADACYEMQISLWFRGKSEKNRTVSVLVIGAIVLVKFNTVQTNVGPAIANFSFS